MMTGIETKGVLYGEHQRKPRSPAFVDKDYLLDYWMDVGSSKEAWTQVDTMMDRLPPTTVADGFKVRSWTLQEHPGQGLLLQLTIRLSDTAPEQTLLEAADTVLGNWVDQMQMDLRC